MAMFADNPVRPEPYQRFEHETPEWFQDAKLGIFIHWGPYSVPAWAEPIGAHGTFDKVYWDTHNPYAEWYYNTMRIAGSPAHAHQQEVYGGAPYDDFLDRWTAERFDASKVMDAIARTGARYVVPTSKHHDGVTLWDAPGTGERNTVRRGPHRDLIGEIHDAAVAHDVRFGVYYSGGLDWHFGGNPPICGDLGDEHRPNDKAYADYAYEHVADLIRRYHPAVLWGDIEWPDAGKPEGERSLVQMLDLYYAEVPDGVVNDRWGMTHWDFRTTEYEAGSAAHEGAWEHTRGIGFSFGHNRLEDASHSLSGTDAIRLFVDTVSRGGNLLLNIGLTAEGEIPELQARTLDALGAWNAVHGDAIFGSRPLRADVGASDEPWTRWTQTKGTARLFVDVPAGETVRVNVSATELAVGDATAGPGVDRLAVEGGVIIITAAADALPGPLRIDIPLRTA